jgi:CRISPR-associated protein Cmr3
MDEYYFISPQDVLMPRGNRSFGDAGEHGEASALPWPSVLAGALRSALLGQDAQRLADFSAGRRLSGAAGEALGTADEPGAFRLTWASLARADDRSAEPLLPLPADLVANGEGDRGKLTCLQSAPLPSGVRAGVELPLVAALRTDKADKPAQGRLLDAAGLRAYLAGELPQSTMSAGAFYEKELRLGIALNPAARTAAEGALYTTEAVRFARHDEPWRRPEAEGRARAPERAASPCDAGYLVGVRGAPGLLPERGTLRLGGDARAAHYRRVPVDLPQPPLAQIAGNKRFRLVLRSPGIFAAGWLPDGVRRFGGDYVLEREGFKATLVCAALPRYEVVSGWDLARMRPKPAQRAVPAGAVYWFDRFEGDPGKLAAWVDGGLWGDDFDAARRAEGFNLAWLAAWR